MIGKTLGHYEITEKLGEGGMGVVYKARDTHLDRFVAIKVLSAEKVGDPNRKRRFIQEAKAASALNHPNIVTIHDITREDGTDFMVMEYVEGKTLDQRIGNRGLRLNDAITCAIQITNALARAHAAGIVHRDLKPTNIMVSDDGTVKVLDFGLAKLTEPIEDHESACTDAITEDGIVIGTTAYMSPEQIDAKKVDARSDIFSLGSVLYEMVTGQKAFQGDSKISTLSKILHMEPKPLTGTVPPGLDRIIQKCLRKERERRFQHIGDVKCELEDLVEQSGPVESRAALPAVAGKRKLVWVLASAGLLAILVLAAWLLAARLFQQRAPLIVQPLTTYPGLETHPSLSPDGRQVAFQWNGEKQVNWDIYVQQVNVGPPLRLTTDPLPDLMPAWSPDGRQIAFCRPKPSGTWSLNLISPLGGPERNIAELAGEPSPIAWTPDGKWLGVSEKLGSMQNHLMLVSVVSREKKPLVTPPAGDIAIDMECAFSPDGKQIAFAREIVWNSVFDIWVSPFPDSESRQLTRFNKSTHFPIWTPGGREIIFSSNRLGTYNLWRIPADTSGRTEPGLIPDTEGAMQAAISNGPPARLVFSRQVTDVNIWVAEMPPGSPGCGPARPLVASTRLDAYAQFSPDGRKILYVSGRAGEEGFWLADSDGMNAIQLSANRMYGAHDWSPDGSKIAFDYLQDLYTLNPSGGEPRPVLTGSTSDNRPRWSRDGRSLYFHSDRSGSREIWKVPAAGGAPVQVTQGGGIEGWEAPDGKTFYYVRNWDAPGLWAMPVGGGEAKPFLDGVWHSWWAMADTGIYFVDFTPRPPVLRFYDFGTRQVKAMMVLDKVERGKTQALTVTRDGRKVAWHQVDRNEADLMQIENFR